MRAAATAARSLQLREHVIITDSRHRRTSRLEPVADDSEGLDWTLALAGGEGVRLSSYVERRFGRRIPKQYCCLLGDRSMLEHTLERLNQIAPPSRTLTVIGAEHREIAMPQLARRSDHVFCQPSSRDTGLALYVALAMIRRWNPNALVTITPTDHYVAPAAAYVAQVRRARAVAARLRDRVIVLGVRPTEPDPELGYMSLGDRVAEVPSLRQLAAFVEKPTVRRAQSLCAAGALWNVKGSSDPSKFDGHVDDGFSAGMLSKRTVVRGPKVDHAAGSV